jgi:hypothetical protein
MVTRKTHERVVGETVEQRCFSDDLVNRVLDRWCSGVGHRVEVKSWMSDKPLCVKIATYRRW